MISKKIVLHFPKNIWGKPIVCHLAKNFDILFSILKAEVTPREEGLVVMELSGKREEYKKGIDFLKEAGVTIQALSQDITRREDVCTHCGACLAVCPTKALSLNRDTLEVAFDPGHCIGCEQCIMACPPRAMEVRF
jgi:ferredoxin